MPPVSTRLLPDHSSESTNGGSGAAVDRYRVYDTTPGVGISYGQVYNTAFLISIGVPQPGSPHPEIGPSLRVRSMRRIPAGNAWTVEVGYAPASGSTDRPPVDTLEPSFTSVENTSRKDKLELPIFGVKKMTFGEGTSATTKYIWDKYDVTEDYEVSREVMTGMVNGEFGEGLNIDQFVAVFPQVRAQLNKIHGFGGTKYKFMGARRISQQTSSSATEAAKWSVQYEWEYDPGIPNNTGITPVAGLIFRPMVVAGQPIPVQAFICQDPQFRIRPYTRADWHANYNDPEQPPIVTFSQPPVEDLNGWQTLPGIFG